VTRRRARPLGHRPWYARLGREEWAGILGITLLIALVSAGAALYLEHAPEKLNVDSLCPISGPKAESIVVIDSTDPLSPSQRTRLQRFFTYELKLAEGERLTIHEIDPEVQEGLSEPFFRRCKVREGRDVNKWIESETYLQREYLEKFLNPLERHLERFTSDKEARRTPLVEAFVDLAGTQPVRKAEHPRHLYVFSDLLQHSTLWSAYQSTPAFKEWMKQPGRSNFVPDLRGVDVTIYLLLRAPAMGGARQDERLVAYWEHFLREAGARLIAVEKVR